MLDSLYKSVLVMSSVSTLIALVLLFIKPFTQKIFGYRWQHGIWYVVLICSLIPISITFQSPDQIHIRENFKIIESVEMTSQNDILPVQNQIRTPGVSHTDSFVSALSLIWTVGTVYLLVISLIRYLLFKREILKNSSLDSEYKGIKVFSTGVLSAPLAMGLFKKKIFIPSTVMDEEEKRHILLHEYTHIRHCDIFYKWLCLFARCIHWFNPLMYVVSSQIDQECEIWCDASVAKDMTEEEKKKYMNIILSLISRSNMPMELTTRMADSKHSIKKRFQAITVGLNQGKFIKCLSVFLMAVLLLTMLFVSGIAGGMAYENDAVCLKFKISEKTNIQFEKTYEDKIEELFEPIEIYDNDACSNFQIL